MTTLYRVSTPDQKLVMIAPETVIQAVFSLHRDAVKRMKNDVASGVICSLYFNRSQARFLGLDTVVVEAQNPNGFVIDEEAFK
jgi:hypothetical protein